MDSETNTIVIYVHTHTFKQQTHIQAIVLYNEGNEEDVTVIHPNEDGSYWRKIVRNKVIRMKEKRREKAAQNFIKEKMGLAADHKLKVRVVTI